MEKKSATPKPPFILLGYLIGTLVFLKERAEALGNGDDGRTIGVCMMYFGGVLLALRWVPETWRKRCLIVGSLLPFLALLEVGDHYRNGFAFLAAGGVAALFYFSWRVGSRPTRPPAAV